MDGKKSRPETEIENRSEKNGCFFSLIETKMTMVLDSNDDDADAMFCVARLSFKKTLGLFWFVSHLSTENR